MKCRGGDLAPSVPHFTRPPGRPFAAPEEVGSSHKVGPSLDNVAALFKSPPLRVECAEAGIWRLARPFARTLRARMLSRPLGLTSNPLG